MTPHPPTAASSDRQSAVDRFFHLASRGSNHKREFIAGMSMFLATAYAVVTIPRMLGDAGLPHGAVITCVIVVMALGTASMGLFGNLPMVLAPGLGGASLVAYTLVADGGVPYPVAMGMVFWSGIAFLLLTLFGIRTLITRIIPTPIRLAIGPAIGIFIAFIGLRQAGLVVAGKKSLEMGDLAAPAALVAVAGTVILLALQSRKVPGAFIIVIAAITVLGIPLGLTEMSGGPASLPANPGEVAFHIDLLGALSPHYLPYLFAFLASEFFATTGVVMTVTEQITEKAPQSAVNITRPFLVDSCTIVGGSLFGAPSVTTYAESTAGAESGGRTGLASLWSALFIALLLFFTPLATAIPAAATAPVLVVVGLTMLSRFQRVQATELTDVIPAAAVVAFTIYWGNFGAGIASGLLMYVAAKSLSGRFNQIHPGMWILTPFLLHFFASTSL